jgi:asparagine synthase (glutamine-hydrolysing)
MATQGLVGIIGDGSIAELDAMAARMPYRGRARIWSPSPQVYLGELSLSPPGTASARDGAALAIDCTGWLYDLAGPDLPDPAVRADSERRRLEADLLEFGAQALSKLRGFFALAFWNSRHKTLTLACDRQGYKGLYFATLEGRLAFASDVKALLALSDCPARFDRGVLQMYLRSRSFSSADSLLEAAHPVGRAKVLTVGQDLTHSSSSYWQPARSGRTPSSLKAAAHDLRGILESVVRGQLAGHDRFGIALSGGLDSAALLALAKHLRPDATIATYTIGHGEQDTDIVRARSAAGFFCSEHHESFYDIERIPTDLKRYVSLTEDLTGREEAILQQVVTAMAANRERLLLAGHGADAAFAGMPRHRILWLRDHSPPPLRGALGEFFTYTQNRREPSSWLGRRLVEWRFRGDRPSMPKVIGEIKDPDSACLPLSIYRRAMLTSLESLRYHEPIDASCDITLAAPFLDPQVLQFSIDCPTRFLITTRAQKRVLRAALHGLAPPRITGLGKTIQRLPHDERLTELLQDFARDLRVQTSLAGRGVIEPGYLAKALDHDHQPAGSSERLHILWTLICTELWFQQFIDRRGALPDGI